MHLPPNWRLLREHRRHALLRLFSLNPWWRYLHHVCSNALTDWTLLGNSWNFNGRIVMSSRYLILRLCFHDLCWFRTLNWLDVLHYLWNLSSFTCIFLHFHGTLIDHRRRRSIPWEFLFISNFLSLSVYLLSFSSQLPLLSLLSLLHVPH